MNKILTILVLYGNNLNESKTFLSWQKFHNLLQIPHRLLIYNNDNSINIPQSVDYELINSTTNDKLQKPYSFALQTAIEENFDFLMLLDQDTELTEDYFLELNDGLDKEIAAFVPICVHGEKQISPFFYNAKLGNYFFSKPAKSCITANCVSAFNACAVFSVFALEKIGGFSEMFDLDFIDNYIFYRLHRSNYKIKILNTKLQHNLSLLDYKTLKLSRYKKIIDAERKFAKILGKKAEFVLSFWLVLRFLKQIIVSEKRRFAKITFSRINSNAEYELDLSSDCLIYQ